MKLYTVSSLFFGRYTTTQKSFRNESDAYLYIFNVADKVVYSTMSERTIKIN